MDESEKTHLSSLGATEMGSELPVHKFVHHHVDDVFQDALDHELSRVKVNAARKEAEDENVKCVCSDPCLFRCSTIKLMSGMIKKTSCAHASMNECMHAITHTYTYTFKNDTTMLNMCTASIRMYV